MTTAAPLTRAREPQEVEYRDTGCDVSPSCLACPLPRCRYDYPSGLAGALRDLRVQRTLELHATGLAGAEIADRLGISLRSVWRDLGRARP